MTIHNGVTKPPIPGKKFNPSSVEVEVSDDQTPKRGRYIELPDSMPGPPIPFLQRMADGGGAVGGQITFELIRLEERGSWLAGPSYITEQDRATLNNIGGSIVNKVLDSIS